MITVLIELFIASRLRVKPIHIFDVCSKNLNEKLRIRFLSFNQIVVVNLYLNNSRLIWIVKVFITR
jgi:hypothetical protein